MFDHTASRLNQNTKTASSDYPLYKVSHDSPAWVVLGRFPTFSRFLSNSPRADEPSYSIPFNQSIIMKVTYVLLLAAAGVALAAPSAEPGYGDYGDYGNYGKYGSYGSYPPPPPPPATYASYGSYKRAVDWIKGLFE